MRKRFVDLQVNGWMGIDFSGPGLTLKDVRRLTLDLAARGTIAYCPTLITSAYETYRENLAVLARAMGDPELGPHILGIHMEGPFISPHPGARGAHPLSYVHKPSVEDFDSFQEWAEGKIVLMTLDPGYPDAARLIEHAVKRGVVVSLGHHFADDAALENAVNAGAKACTHLGNGLPNEIPRHQNPLWWQLACDDLWGMFIVDGQHLPPSLVRVALRAKTVGRFIVTSDASSLAGMPPGKHKAFGLNVVISEAGRIYSEESKSLVGSHSTMLECMNFLASLKILPEADLWKVGQLNPMMLLGRGPDSLDAVPGPDVVFDGAAFRVSGQAS